MTLTPFTTTCKFPITRDEFLNTAAHFSDSEGMFLLYSGGCGVSTLFLFPSRVIRLSQDAPWEKLEKTITTDECWVGFLTYEMGAFSEAKKKIPYFDSELPLAYFQQSRLRATFDHAQSMVTVESDIGEALNPHFWKRERVKAKKFNALLLSPIESFESHAEKIRKAKEYIYSGDIYQVNLSHKVELKGDIDSFSLFLGLAKSNPVPYSAYCHIKECTIISASPEKLLKKKGRVIETRPIKGTMPRGSNPIEDELFKKKLLESQKERSELLMITDLMRNDLGRIAICGSVKVDQLFHLETYASVHHLVSEISALVDGSLHNVEILRNVFPGGSITGCPKLRSMEIIYEIEKGPRGIYTGSIGYFDKGGDFTFNIAIRTLVKKEDRLSLHLGGGIVIDSENVKEYEETLHKGKPFFKLLNA